MNNKVYALITIILVCISVFATIMLTPVIVGTEEEEVEVSFAYQFGFHYGTHIIMDHFDLVEKYSNGTAVAVFQKISGGATINEAIVAGSVQFASMSGHAGMKGIDKGIGTKIFASMGCKVAELWTWRDDVHSVEDLDEGDLVNVVKVAATQYVSMIKAYSDLNRSKEEAEAIFTYFSHPDAYMLMQQKEIDAAFTGPPYNQLYADLGYHKIADEMSIWGTPLPGGCLIASVKFCEEHPDIAAAVMYAWIDATNWIINNPAEASRIIGGAYEYTAAESWKLWKEANLTWSPTYGLEALEELASAMYGLGLLENELTLKDILFDQTRGMIGR